jgi:Flp pilus assembly protein TadG
MWSPGAPRTATAPLRRRFRRGLRLNHRGQGLVEFSISFPIVLLMILFGVDFGRVFLGWVTLSNAAREAANFAALNPHAWTDGAIAAQAEYARLINSEAAGINCTLPGSPPPPTFPNGTDLGSPTIVSITCQFHLITPLIGNIVGNPLNVTASASFPVRNGAIEGTPLGGTLPSFSTTTTTTTTNTTTTTTNTTTTTSTTTTSTGPTPVPNCIVPNLVDVQTSQAVSRWTSAGFSAGNLTFSPLVPPNYKIKHQSPLTAGSSVLCNSSMTVSP